MDYDLDRLAQWGYLHREEEQRKCTILDVNTITGYCAETSVLIGTFRWCETDMYMIDVEREMKNDPFYAINPYDTYRTHHVPSTGFPRCGDIIRIYNNYSISDGVLFRAGKVGVGVLTLAQITNYVTPEHKLTMVDIARVVKQLDMTESFTHNELVETIIGMTML